MPRGAIPKSHEPIKFFWSIATPWIETKLHMQFNISEHCVLPRRPDTISWSLDTWLSYQIKYCVLPWCPEAVSCIPDTWLKFYCSVSLTNWTKWSYITEHCVLPRMPGGKLWAMWGPCHADLIQTKKQWPKVSCTGLTWNCIRSWVRVVCVSGCP